MIYRHTDIDNDWQLLLNMFDMRLIARTAENNGNYFDLGAPSFAFLVLCPVIQPDLQSRGMFSTNNPRPLSDYPFYP